MIRFSIRYSARGFRPPALVSMMRSRSAVVVTSVPRLCASMLIRSTSGNEASSGTPRRPRKCHSCAIEAADQLVAGREAKVHLLVRGLLVRRVETRCQSSREPRHREVEAKLESDAVLHHRRSAQIGDSNVLRDVKPVLPARRERSANLPEDTGVRMDIVPGATPLARGQQRIG